MNLLMSKYESKEESIMQIETGGESLEWTQNAVSIVDDGGPFKNFKSKISKKKSSMTTSNSKLKIEDSEILGFEDEFDLIKKKKNTKNLALSNIIHKKNDQPDDIKQSLRSSFSSIEIEEFVEANSSQHESKIIGEINKVIEEFND